MGKKGTCRYDLQKIRDLSDGKRTSEEIGILVGCRAKFVQRVQKRENLPRLPQAPRPGVHNPCWRGGRTIDRDGYALVRAPKGHPHARVIGTILEHRLVVEQMIGRYLDPKEVVDHIDGNKLNNDPANLRIYASNAEHLKATLTGKVPNWSAFAAAKLQHMGKHRDEIGRLLPTEIQQVDTYRQRKRSGDVRRTQILQARVELEEDSPYLLGTERFLEPTPTVPHPKKRNESDL